MRDASRSAAWLLLLSALLASCAAGSGSIRSAPAGPAARDPPSPGEVADAPPADASHVEENDVSRQYFDRDVAMRNLEITLERLRELARQPDAKLSDVMQVERELTRVRYRTFLVELTGRAIGLWYNRDMSPRSDLLLEATLGVGVPF